MNLAVRQAFICFDAGDKRSQRFSAPGCNTAVARTGAAAMPAEAPRAVAASGGGAVGGFARTRMRRGVDGFAVVIAIGLVVIEVRLVRGGVRVGERVGATECKGGGEENRGGAPIETCRHYFYFGPEERARLRWWLGSPHCRSGDPPEAIRNRALPDSSRVFYLPMPAGVRPFSRPPPQEGFLAECRVQAGSCEPHHCC
jgi:hypothetical protein